MSDIKTYAKQTYLILITVPLRAVDAAAPRFVGRRVRLDIPPI